MEMAEGELTLRRNFDRLEERRSESLPVQDCSSHYSSIFQSVHATAVSRCTG